MRCYIAKAGGQVFSGSWQACVNWGLDKAKNDSSILVKIHAGRAGEKLARVISEIGDNGIRPISNGRYVPLRKLRGA